MENTVFKGRFIKEIDGAIEREEFRFKKLALEQMFEEHRQVFGEPHKEEVLKLDKLSLAELKVLYDQVRTQRNSWLRERCMELPRLIGGILKQLGKIGVGAYVELGVNDRSSPAEIEARCIELEEILCKARGELHKQREREEGGKASTDRRRPMRPVDPSRVTLFVGNLPYDKATEDGVRAFFTESGCSPLKISIMLRDGQPNGVAFVDVKAEEAEAIIAATNGEKLGGRVIKVAVKEVKERRQPEAPTGPPAESQQAADPQPKDPPKQDRGKDERPSKPRGKKARKAAEAAAGGGKQEPPKKGEAPTKLPSPPTDPQPSGTGEDGRVTLGDQVGTELSALRETLPSRPPVH